MTTAVSPLLNVPRKTTSEVDYASSIRQIISTTYSEPPDRYAEEIASLNRTRQDAVRGSAGSDMTARDLLYRYFGQLELLELRFPELRVPFPWNDAFSPGKSISQLSLAYEKASVIFNIAATLSALAANQNRTSPEGLKRSFNYFRSAAGMFTYINDNFLHAPSTDLGRDLVKCLITLMTAQATEVFLERMNEEKRSPGLKSKICAQVAAVYAGIVEDIKEHVSKGIFDRCWLVLVQTKAKYFASLASYNRGLADIASTKQGEGLGRMNVAETLSKEAVRLSQTWGSSFYVNAAASAAATLPADAGTSLIELCKQHATLVSEARAGALKDNDLIYHAVVPSEASQAPIEKAANVAEPIPIQEIYASPEVQKLVGQDIFIKLVPLSVIESSSMYSEEKAKILRTEGERCDMADGEMQATIEHLGLPGSLAKFGAASASAGAGDVDPRTAMADPGPQVRSWSSEIASNEHGRRLDSAIGELTQLRDRASADLEYCASQLDAEQRECEQARVRFDYHFEQSPSAGYTRSWRTDIKNDREALNQARASDDHVLALWASVRDDVARMAGGEDAVEQAFAEALAQSDQNGTSGTGGQRSLLDLDLDVDIPDEEGAEMQRRIASIHESLAKLTKLQKERNDTLADLKERVHNDDISQLLILNRKSQNVEPTLFAAELEKFRPHQARLQAALQQQQATLASIQTAYSQLSTGKKGREIQNRYARAERAKKELQARFKRAYDAYKEVQVGVSKGTDFYRELAGLVSTLRSEVAQFVSSRASERSQMISSAEMKQRLAGGATRAPSGLQEASSGLENSFGSMSLGSRQDIRSPPTPASPTSYSQQPVSPSRGGYSSMPPPPPVQLFSQASASYSYQPPPSSSSPAFSASSYGGYQNGSSNGYSSSSTPSLPPKPAAQPGNSPYRHASGSLPPPPSQPQYSQYQQPQSSHFPPPPPPQHQSPYSGGSYSSAGYAQRPSLPPRPSAQQPTYSHQPASSPYPSQGSPQPLSGQQQVYGQQQPYQPTPQYGQQPQAPPRPPPHQTYDSTAQPSQPYYQQQQQSYQPQQQQYRY